MAHVIDKYELPHSETAHRFEGYRRGDANVSFFLIDEPPGAIRGCTPLRGGLRDSGGRVTFTVGDATIEATGGQIVVVPAGVPHKFVNSGAGGARHIDIHTSRRMITEWLEDEVGTRSAIRR